MTDFRIEVTSTGEKRLRFTTQIANLGPGVFEVYAKRPNTDTANMTVFQRVHDTAGGYRSILVTGTHAFYSGDGHNHWHIFKLQEFEIRNLNADGTEGSIAGSGAKTGFCFYDNTVYNLTPPQRPSEPPLQGLWHRILPEHKDRRKRWLGRHVRGEPALSVDQDQRPSGRELQGSSQDRPQELVCRGCRVEQQHLQNRQDHRQHRSQGLRRALGRDRQFVWRCKG